MMMEKQHFNQRNLVAEFQEILPKYALTDYLGSGAYGIVCAVREKESDKSFAIKKCKNIFHSRTLAKRTLREMRLLRYITHPHIVELKKAFITEDTESFSDLYLVFELLDTDLAQVIKSPQRLRVEHIQHFSHQLLQAIKFLHDANIVHRDIKPRNILINSDCTLKLADFGLARAFQDGIDHTTFAITDYVTTRWYRAPEILAGWTYYGKAIDLWAVGCIIAELFKRAPLFPGIDSVKQLELLLTTLGRPEESFTIKCKKASKRLFIRTFDSEKTKTLDLLIGDATVEAQDLIRQLLVFDPMKRLSATECLYHSFFQTYPSQELSKVITIQIPVTAFEHEKWKPTIEEYRAEILKEVEDFLPVDDNTSYQSTTLLFGDEVGARFDSDETKIEKLSNSTAITNVISLNSVTHLENSDSTGILRRKIIAKPDKTLHSKTDCTEKALLRQKRRNMSRETVVEDFMMISNESSKAKGVSVVEHTALLPPRSFIDASCQVDERDFPSILDEGLKVGKNVQSDPKHVSPSFSCGMENKQSLCLKKCEKPVVCGDASIDQTIKSVCVVC